MAEPDPFAAVKRRHPRIPQEPLPLELPTASPSSAPRGRTTPSIRQATCPYCAKTTTTGVIRNRDGTEVFRPHNKTLFNGRSIRCNGSGKEAPK